MATCFGAGKECLNTVGSFICTCATGFKLNQDTGACVDIDECEVTRGNACGIDSECQNSAGSYRFD